MKSMKLLEVVKMLELNGFTLMRSNGHLIYGHGTLRVALAHARIVSPGVLRSVMRVINQSQEIQRKVA